jgi:DNA-binding NtrC family response regulator
MRGFHATTFDARILQLALSNVRSPMPDSAPTVYVVDDDISGREALEGLIQVSGWNARVFASATDFLDSAPVAGPSCHVLDVGLPGLNGLACGPSSSPAMATCP